MSEVKECVPLNIIRLAEKRATPLVKALPLMDYSLLHMMTVCYLLGLRDMSQALNRRRDLP